MFYDRTPYFYQLNLQGDVIGIVDTTGASAAKYAYAAWGRMVYSTGSMAAIHPIPRAFAIYEMALVSVLILAVCNETALPELAAWQHGPYSYSMPTEPLRKKHMIFLPSCDILILYG